MTLSMDYQYRVLMCPGEAIGFRGALQVRGEHYSIWQDNRAGFPITPEFSRNLNDELTGIACMFPGRFIDFRMYSGNKRGYEIKDLELLSKKARKSVANSPNRAS